jgi:hypothetical protein
LVVSNLLGDLGVLGRSTIKPPRKLGRNTEIAALQLVVYGRAECPSQMLGSTARLDLEQPCMVNQYCSYGPFYAIAKPRFLGILTSLGFSSDFQQTARGVYWLHALLMLTMARIPVTPTINRAHYKLDVLIPVRLNLRVLGILCCGPGLLLSSHSSMFLLIPTS